MKRTKRILALVLAFVLCMAMGTTAFAAEEPSTPSITIKTTSETAEGQSDTTEYKWYRIFEADIEEDPVQDGATQSGGKVAYYIDSAAKEAQIEATGLFNITKVVDIDKWYVELKEGKTVQEIATAFAAMDLDVFPTGGFAQTTIGGSATSGEVPPGYYFITSTAGANVVIQTLTAVEIDEKNTFPTVEKKIDETDKHAQIGDEIGFTLTVSVPQSANDEIVLTDVMTQGLTFLRFDHVKVGEADVPYTVDPENPIRDFTITFSKETVIANRGKEIEVKYTAILNNKAVVDKPEKNTVTLAYGEDYTSKPKEVETNTYSFDFDKVDGKNIATKLTGAKFELKRDNTVLPLVVIEEGKTYRIAMSDDTATVTEITTKGATVTINGLDTDATYYLHETKAPTGYNVLESDVEVKVGETGKFDHQDIKNYKGTVLPSTGGMGTTVFYVVGGILVVGAAVLLISKRRMSDR